MTPAEQSTYQELRRRTRLRLLQMHFESHVGHIGGNLSALDLLLCLHHHVMQPKDVFVLSKGHAAGALYITLWSLGKLSDADLKSFHCEGTLLAGHPPFQGLPGVIFGTGSLGHGLGLSAGLALAKRLKATSGRVYCLMSDGEWNEGSCWESLIFLVHQNLNNLTFVIDLNGLQGFGSTRDVANLEPLAEKLRAFGIQVWEIDGHDPAAIRNAFRQVDTRTPSAILAKTRKGCGISFMENRLEWHYLPMSQEQYSQAQREVDQACEPLFANHS